MTEAEPSQPKCLTALPMALQHVGGGSTLAFSYLSGEALDRGLAAPRAGNPRVSLNIDTALVEGTGLRGCRGFVLRSYVVLDFDIK